MTHIKKQVTQKYGCPVAIAFTRTSIKIIGVARTFVSLAQGCFSPMRYSQYVLNFFIFVFVLMVSVSPTLYYTYTVVSGNVTNHTAQLTFHNMIFLFQYL